MAEPQILLNSRYVCYVFLSGDDDTTEFSEHMPTVRSNCLLTGFCFGSLLYMTQAVFGEVSLVSRWVVGGYPSTGPMPYPWG